MCPVVTIDTLDSPGDKTIETGGGQNHNHL
jgi:hypothetical protein